MAVVGDGYHELELSVLGYPVIPDADVNAAVAANNNLLVVPGGSAARQLAETDAACQLVEPHLTKGRDHYDAGSAGGRRPVGGALYAGKLAYPAVSRAKAGLGDQVIRGVPADNPRRLPQLTPA